MANSPLVSIRIPPEMLKRVDELAQKMYPSRRAGKNPNRSQVILDAIAQFLEQNETSCANTMEIEQELNQEIESKEEDGKIPDELIIRKLQQYSQAQEHPINLHYLKPMEAPMRDYINWWFDYYSYMKKLTDAWFSAKY